MKAHGARSKTKDTTVHPMMMSKPRPLYAGMKAIVIEDDRETSRFCRRFLENDGFDVREADRGVAALMEIREEHPDLILVGLQLRDVVGVELVCWLKADPTLSQVPIVAISTHSLRLDDPTLRGSGIGAVLRKPLSAEAVARAVRRVLG